MQYLKKFVSYYKYEWKLFLIDLVCAGLLAGIDLLFPIATRMFMKDLIPNRQLQTMIYFIAAPSSVYHPSPAPVHCRYWGHVWSIHGIPMAKTCSPISRL